MRASLTCFFLFTIIFSFAQAPKGINYQAIMRDANGNPISMPLSIAIEIYSNGSGAGIPDFSENHIAIPDAETGLFNLTIGKNNPTEFTNIDWASGSKYMKTTVNGIPGPLTEMVSVPYALFAQEAANAGNEYFAGTGISIIDNVVHNAGDLNDTNEIQQLTLDGNTLTLSHGGGTVYLSSLTINGELNYLAKFTPDGTNIGNSVIFDDGTNVGIGITNPDEKLDVAGNAQVSGYLKVGDPSFPSSAASYTPLPLYKLSYSSGTETWSVDSDCGGSLFSQWFVEATGSNAGTIFYTSLGNYNRSYVYSPWIWAPSGALNLLVEGTVYCNLEDNFDGVFLEYRIGNGVWNKISNFQHGGYPDDANGSNTVCNATDFQACWNGIGNTWFFRVAYSAFPSNLFGNWIRFRFVGMEDSSLGNGVFELYGFNVTAFGGAPIGGQFAEGNIYAEKNVYAGSNVLLGDVAEYFIVDVDTEPGDLIALSPGKNDCYTISDKAYNPYILGIHSTNPTVTLNAPIGAPVSLTGRVPVKVSGENGPIEIGDYLTAASLHGHAMRADKSCFIVGRALENFDGSGTGHILCIVETGWYNPGGGPNNFFVGGSFILKKGNNSAIVNDPSIHSGSRIFVTPKDNAGCYWVNNVSDGSFTINIERSPENNIPFDYFVDNAKNVKTEDGKLETQHNKKGKSAGTLLEKDRSNKVQLQEYSETIPPGLPPNPITGWIWSTKTGFLRSNLD